MVVLRGWFLAKLLLAKDCIFCGGSEGICRREEGFLVKGIGVELRSERLGLRIF